MDSLSSVGLTGSGVSSTSHILEISSTTEKAEAGEIKLSFTLHKSNRSNQDLFVGDEKKLHLFYNTEKKTNNSSYYIQP